MPMFTSKERRELIYDLYNDEEKSGAAALLLVIDEIFGDCTEDCTTCPMKPEKEGE